MSYIESLLVASLSGTKHEPFYFLAALNKNNPEGLRTLSINVLKTVQTVSHLLLHPLMWFGTQQSGQAMQLKSPHADVS